MPSPTRSSRSKPSSTANAAAVRQQGRLTRAGDAQPAGQHGARPSDAHGGGLLRAVGLLVERAVPGGVDEAGPAGAGHIQRDYCYSLLVIPYVLSNTY